MSWFILLNMLWYLTSQATGISKEFLGRTWNLHLILSLVGTSRALFSLKETEPLGLPLLNFSTLLWVTLQVYFVHIILSPRFLHFKTGLFHKNLQDKQVVTICTLSMSNTEPRYLKIWIFTGTRSEFSWGVLVQTSC